MGSSASRKVCNMTIAVRERTLAIPDEHAEVLSDASVPRRSPDTDPNVPRAARIAWRDAHRAQWQASMANLSHYDPTYAYSVVHEYEDDWTTDPDYSVDGLHHLEFDADGNLIPVEIRHYQMQLATTFTLSDTSPRRTDAEVQFDFPEALGRAVQLRDRNDEPASRVRPDLVMFPAGMELPPDRRYSYRQERILRFHGDADPVPALVVEITSPSTRRKDLGAKRKLYAALGIAEYLVFNCGTSEQDPVHLHVFQLVGDEYIEASRVNDDTGADVQAVPEFESTACGTRIRLSPDPEEGMRVPRFQWYDREQGRWRDRETDKEHDQDRLQRERETELAIEVLHEFLGETLEPADLDRIEKAWRRDGSPKGYLRRIRTVQRMPQKWRSLLEMPPDDDGLFEGDTAPSAGEE